MDKFDIYEVLKHLPHRYPFLLIDRVTGCVPSKSLTALKNVTINEPFFQGHFPHYPVMPGVLVVEAMAHACAILSFKTLGELPGDEAVYLFVGIDKARFKHPVVPGDQLKIDVTLDRKVQNIWKFSGTAHVDGKLCSSAELMCTYRKLP
ncbi:MAG TPA: 3-hydroxyacyl-ACP dehydratase FabZ [Acidiferrobacteraceae bacterium]|nr:3-hydroxyacyl-ACP dehydratase FabZ [Acidiferrobacteraceae bacterium]